MKSALLLLGVLLLAGAARTATGNARVVKVEARLVEFIEHKSTAAHADASILGTGTQATWQELASREDACLAKLPAIDVELDRETSWSVLRTVHYPVEYTKEGAVKKTGRREVGTKAKVRVIPSGQDHFDVEINFENVRQMTPAIYGPQVFQPRFVSQRMTTTAALRKGDWRVVSSGPPQDAGDGFQARQCLMFRILP